MHLKTVMNKYARRLLPIALPLLFACPAMAESALKPQPAVATTAATKAMMLATARAGKRIVVVGDHGIILLSDDDGANFRQARSVPVRSTLTAVSFVDDKQGWAAGQWGVVLMTGDGGETWQLQRIDTAVDQPLFSVYFKDKEHGWGVGLWSLMLTTSDGGKNWSAVTLPAQPGGGKAGRNLFRIFTSGKGTVFVAAEQGTVLRSVDGGANWTFVNTGYKGSFWTGTALKDGTLLVGGLRGTIYRSTDDGRTWKEVQSGVKSSITDFGEADGKVFAVGLDGVFLESADNGATFKASQREDRLPLTALAIAGTGRPVAFSKQGVVKNFPEEKKK